MLADKAERTCLEVSGLLLINEKVNVIRFPGIGIESSYGHVIPGTVPALSPTTVV